MVEVGDEAPEITGFEVVKDEFEKFKLSNELGDGPVVLAFFPAAFSPPCTNELVSLQQKIDAFREQDAKVYGISVDNPFALQAFKENEGFEFSLISDNNGNAAEAFDIKKDIEEVHVQDVANRSVFIVDKEGKITYKWEAEDNLDEKCMDEIIEILRHLRENY